jgi:hypothetical protein
VRAASAELKARGNPFFAAKVFGNEVARLLELFDQCAKQPRSWYTFASMQPDLKSLIIFQADTPAYELKAAPVYARGDLFRVTGGARSCGIDFAGDEGAAYLARRLRAAEQRMKDFVEIRVPSSKRHIIEFCPDVDTLSGRLTETDRLGIAGERAAVKILPSEDFSDWE